MSGPYHVAATLFSPNFGDLSRRASKIGRRFGDPAREPGHSSMTDYVVSTLINVS